MPKAPRILQACQECRKRKTRCDGVRPHCDVCARKHKPCHWSEALAPGGYRYVLFGESTSGGSPASTPTPTTQPREALYDTDHAFDLLRLPLRHRLVHIFAQTHHILELCGCIQLDVFNDQVITNENSFLLESILALSALYLPDAEAKADSQFTGSKSIVRHYRSKAQASSRQSSDQPTIVNIQANLVLGLCELLTMATSKAWLHIGLAVRMAQTLRMRNEYNCRHIPRKREIRRRTFWACVILDRLVAYCTFRTQTIDLSLVKLHLPCSEIAFAFGHDSPGPKIEELGAGSDLSSEKMTLSYFVKTFLLWSPIAQAYVDGGRRVAPSSPHDPASRHWESQAAFEAWRDCLPREMQWSESNLQAHKSLGQLSHFASMHLLIQHALFLAHHEYLPQIEDTELPERMSSLPIFETTATLSNPEDPATITTCVFGANRVVSMLRLIDTTSTEFGHTPLGTCTGIPIVTAASVLLWVRYCSPLVAISVQPSESDIRQARTDVDYLLSLLDSWARIWVLAKAFASSIRLLDDFYQSRYGRGMHDAITRNMDTMHKNSAGNQTKFTESVAASPTPLQDGDGFPEVTRIPPGTYYKVRLITGLVLEQPELCKKFLHIFGEPVTEAAEQQVDPWEADDFRWMNDLDLLTASSLWTDSALQIEE